MAASAENLDSAQENPTAAERQSSLSDNVEQQFTLMCWNINGLAPTLPNIRLKHPGKGNPLGSFFSAHNLDAVCFQEMKMPADKMTQEVACVPGYESFWAISRERQSYSGVTTWLRAPPWCPVAATADDVGAATGSDADLDREGRVVVTDLGAFVLVNVYVPNAGDKPERPRLAFKIRFLTALQARVRQFVNQGKEVIIVGDFNVAADRRDMHSTYNYAESYAPHELQLLHELTDQFIDVWRRLHPTAEDCYTVWEERTNARAFNAGTRIDYVLVSPGLVDKVVSCEILSDMPWKWSDHAPLLLKLRDVHGLGQRPACELSSRRMPRFNPAGAGRSITQMFAAAAGKGANKRPRLGGETAIPATSNPPFNTQQAATPITTLSGTCGGKETAGQAVAGGAVLAGHASCAGLALPGTCSKPAGEAQQGAGGSIAPGHDGQSSAPEAPHGMEAGPGPGTLNETHGQHLQGDSLVAGGLILLPPQHQQQPQQEEEEQQQGTEGGASSQTDTLVEAALSQVELQGSQQAAPAQQPSRGDTGHGKGQHSLPTAVAVAASPPDPKPPAKSGRAGKPAKGAGRGSKGNQSLPSSQQRSITSFFNKT